MQKPVTTPKKPDLFSTDQPPVRMTYNGMNIPPLIRTDRIISAFANEINSAKVEEYAAIMRAEMLGHDFPAIMGYPTIIDENDVGGEYMTGDPVYPDHVGQLVWKVTDGHHRTLAAINANLPHLATELDYSCITREEELHV